MATLYDIALEGKLIEEILASNDGELTPELEERLDELLRAGTDKLEAAAKVVKHLQFCAKQAMEEVRRLKDRAASFEAQAERLKARMAIALDAAFGGKIKTPLFTIYTQKAADRITFELAEGFSFDHLMKEDPDLVKKEYSLNTERLKELYKGGDILPEAIKVTETEGKRFTQIR